ncbi:PQQ-binding-like beta-propeller repeat protein [Haloterrigena sp. SYSU A121-1]|uniref:PQQ-binding-like beta-propeller repeat protein n=1 Tax=Haloterrigena gelatinilytica TaxID=2741724 RepID=A0A8J8GMK7_9EURY|nr:PQQ-binding-like beta-propeller repeat protein [Haloterrigena gelatinilytica]NUB92828.1 PQQ-binding-like beta-propeller repeat protein [Haloterrigena gelatinilytica]
MWKRRSVLATGAALSIGTGLASVGAGAAEADVDELPDPDRDPGPNEDWPSHRGDPGHARYVADGHEFDGGALEAAWSVDGAGADSVAVADETVYASTDGGVVALDAADGTVVWENADVDASDPSVAGETVFFTGNEIVALDRSDGSVRWESEFDPEAEIVWQTVAYGGVYVVVGGTLYALEADDGSVRWKKESITAAPYGNEEDEYEFVAATAAANGVIYSVTGAGPIALEPETGTEVWQEGTYVSSSDYTNAIYATSAAVGYDISGSPEVPLHDAQTGESVDIGYGQIAFGEEIHVGGGDNGYGGSSIRGDEYSWGLDVMYTYGQAVISGETVFVYFTRDGGPPDPEWRDYDEELVALNKYDGSEKWALSTDDAPVGSIRAVSGETIYVDHDGELVALREETDTDDQSDESDESDDTDGGNDEGDGSDEGDDQQDGEDDGDAGEDDSDDEDECPCPDDDPADDDGSSGDGESVDDGDVGNGTTGDGDAGNETNAGNETDTENDTDADNVPGFTTGGGLLGGALGLEWLRRKAGVDESTGVNEPSE